MEIKKWMENNLIVDRFPVGAEVRENGKHSDVRVIINVSDDFYLGNSEEIMKSGKLNYYFPMGESSSSMGISSIFGAMHVMYEVCKWNPEWKILIHCQAGRNRSPTIADAFYFMMTGEHSEENCRLKYNCEKSHLPELKLMENFLTKCKEAFDNQHKFIGGMYDWVIIESGI